MPDPFTVYDLVVRMEPALAAKDSLTGADFERNGLPFFGGCQVCEASICAGNACLGLNGMLVGQCCANEDNAHTDIEAYLALPIE